MTTLSYLNVQEAIDTLGSNYRLETANLESVALQDIASINGTPEYLDHGDLFAVLANADQLQDTDYNKDFCQSVLRSYLDFPQEDPDGISLEFSTLRLPSGSTIAKTIITPDNLNPDKEPIIFAGGIFHNTPVYLDFLSQIAQQTGREICAFDSPGVGSSRFDDQSLTYKALAESFPAVISSQYGDGRSVITMAHSLGTVGLRHIYKKIEKRGQDLISNPVTKYVFVAPVPAPGELNQFSGAYVADGVKGMTQNKGILEPGENAYDFYAQEHTDAQWQGLHDMISHERMPATVGPYMGVVLKTNARPIKKDFDDPKVAYVMMENDNVFVSNPRKQARAEKAGAHIIAGADHSAIASPTVYQDLVDQFVAIIEE
jgi:hypothetical protein